jgi:7-dehydrocholesterol reductase
MHDRFGFYISWGVLAWVPAVYPIAQLYLAAHPTELPWWGAVLIVLFGLAMLGANYAADAQRQRVRQTNGRCYVWGKPPSVIRAEYRTEDGHVRHNLLLTSGFWGIARHFHYVPEILTALAWTIPVGLHSAAAYFYVAFLTVLLFHRAYRDDERCAAKYGDAWEEYRRGVPYKIVPGVY